MTSEKLQLERPHHYRSTPTHRLRNASNFCAPPRHSVLSGFCFERVASMGPGDFFGEGGVVSAQPRGESVRAATPVKVRFYFILYA